MKTLMDTYFKIFSFLAKDRLKKNDLDFRRIHTHTVAVLSTGLLMWAYAFLAYFTVDSPIPGRVGFICAVIHLLSPLLFRITSNIFLISNITMGAGIIHQGTFAYYTGGFESQVLIWFGILPLLAGIMAGRGSAILWAVITTIWAGIYAVLDYVGYQFPYLITRNGWHIAQGFIIFGWIFLGTSLIYIVLSMNEHQEAKLSEQGAKIDDLFRVLFHDLAGPLSRVMIGLSISRRETSPQNKEHGIDIAIKASDTMLEITQNVRKMYAVTKGKLTNDLSYCPLTEAVEYIEKVYEMELEKKNLKIDYDAKRYHGLSVLVEAVSFKNQVLGNAISNAIKFSSPNSKITIRAYPETHFHVVEIIDHGVGMPKTILDSLFDISKKTSRPGTSGEAGTGFGMHILKSFMEIYQGKIEVESREHENGLSGTTIRLYLKAEWH